MAFACGSCSKELPVGGNWVGHPLRCPWCGVTAPVRAAEPPPPPPARPAPSSLGLWLAVGAAAFGLLLITAVGVASAVLVARARVTAPAAGPPAPLAGTGQPVPLIDPLLDGGLDDKFAEFMGVKAKGHRFCVIADVSGSMQANNRIGRLRDEMEQTIKGLAADQQFSLIVFHSRAEPMPGGGWLRGGADVERVLPWVRGQKPRGGTQPMAAFEMALQLQPRPEAVFFMTDGIIPTTVPARVKGLNERNSPKVPIHTILFGGEVALRPGAKVNEATRKRFEEMKRRGEAMLKQLADDSGGSYRYVPDTLR